jgi:hypothetical protein
MSNEGVARQRGLDALRAHAASVDAIQEQVRNLWEDVAPLIVGLRVRRYGRIWQICSGNTYRGIVHVYGVTVRGDKIGTRGFSLGRLDECEVLECSS